MNSSLFVYVHLLELVARAVVFMNKRVHELFIYVHLETDSAKRRTLDFSRLYVSSFCPHAPCVKSAASKAQNTHTTHCTAVHTTGFAAHVKTVIYLLNTHTRSKVPHRRENERSAGPPMWFGVRDHPPRMQYPLSPPCSPN